MKKNTELIALTVIAVLMIGCAKKMWINPNVTNEQAQKDFAVCQYDSVKHTPGYDLIGDPIAAGISEGMRKNDIMASCMSSKGYSLKSQQNPDDMTDQQRTVMDRYKRAIAKQKEKNDAIGEHIVSVCRPKDDKGYIDCLNESQIEQVNVAIFPDLATKMFKEEEEFKQQLLRKEITRKEFKEYAEKSIAPFAKQMEARLDSDVKAGIYTGNSKY